MLKLDFMSNLPDYTYILLHVDIEFGEGTSTGMFSLLVQPSFTSTYHLYCKCSFRDTPWMAALPV